MRSLVDRRDLLADEEKWRGRKGWNHQDMGDIGGYWGMGWVCRNKTD